MARKEKKKRKKYCDLHWGWDPLLLGQSLESKTLLPYLMAEAMMPLGPYPSSSKTLFYIDNNSWWLPPGDYLTGQKMFLDRAQSADPPAQKSQKTCSTRPLQNTRHVDTTEEEITHKGVSRQNGRQRRCLHVWEFGRRTRSGKIMSCHTIQRKMCHGTAQILHIDRPAYVDCLSLMRE